MSKPRSLFVALALLAAGGAAHAQAVPAGEGAFAYAEKLKVKGCDSFALIAILTFTVAANGTWTASANFGDFSGTLSPADSKGRTWNLVFDGPSLALYEGYLEGVAEDLCGVPVNVTSIDIDRFQVKFGKELSRVAFQLKAGLQGSSAFGPGGGGHSLKGKGVFDPD
jgi:hypothetical protein